MRERLGGARKETLFGISATDRMNDSTGFGLRPQFIDLGEVKGRSGTRWTNLFPSDEIDIVPEVCAHARVIRVAWVIPHCVIPNFYLDAHGLEDPLKSSLQNRRIRLVEIIVMSSGDRGATEANHKLSHIVPFTLKILNK
jgi:hypothetical protein